MPFINIQLTLVNSLINRQKSTQVIDFQNLITLLTLLTNYTTTTNLSLL